VRAVSGDASCSDGLNGSARQRSPKDRVWVLPRYPGHNVLKEEDALQLVLRPTITLDGGRYVWSGIHIPSKFPCVETVVGKRTDPL